MQVSLMFRNSMMVLTLCGGAILAHATPTATLPHPAPPQSLNAAPMHDMKKMNAEQPQAAHQKMQQHRQKRHAEREALNQACVGRDGQAITAKMNDKSIAGQCKTVFRPIEKDAKPQHKHHPHPSHSPVSAAR